MQITVNRLGSGQTDDLPLFTPSFTVFAGIPVEIHLISLSEETMTAMIQTESHRLRPYHHYDRLLSF